MAVYQTTPKSSGLDSVAWKMITVPKSEFGDVKCEVNDNVALADHRQTKLQGVYFATRVRPTTLGEEWKIEFEDGTRQLSRVGDLSPALGDNIVIHNKSGLQASPGVGMNGNASVYKCNISNNAKVRFKVAPTDWAGLFRNVELGEVIIEIK